MSSEEMHRAFPENLLENAPLAQYTAARIGGPAQYLLTVHSAGELAKAVELLWEMGREFRVLGGGSNVLVADKGVSGVVLLNQAKQVKFVADGVRALSGASLSSVARRAVDRGLSGMEWAAPVPGTIGGAIVGNAGAHGSDTADSLETAVVIHREQGRAVWSPERLEFGYRTSWFKRNPGEAVVESGQFHLEPSDPVETRGRMEEFIDYRQQTQPTGASIGSMFKNPPDAHAGRLIDAAGLKGERRGEAEISDKHANFFINRGGASAADVYGLIQLARQRVADEFGVELELEVELIGDWEGNG
ncbi:MAG: UDP-N-acetylmuramate dehydrogenase [Anaerolineales bacterium]